jgi:hypothetical protein
MSITIEQFEQLDTEQKIFDYVTNHLLMQKDRSRHMTGQCAYRDVDRGYSCAVGCLIPDAWYNPRMEHQSVCTLTRLTHIEQLKNLITVNKHLLSRLQQTHDTVVPEKWKIALKELAEEYNLTFNPPAIA